MWVSNPFEITRVEDVPTMEMTLGIDSIVIFSYQIHIRMTDKIKKIQSEDYDIVSKINICMI